MVLLTEIEHSQDAAQVAEKMISTFAVEQLVNEQPINVTLSIGISLYPNDADNADSLIKFAMRSDAYETGAFFVKQMPAKALVAEDLEAWAAANGFGASPLINDIKARIGQY